MVKTVSNGMAKLGAAVLALAVAVALACGLTAAPASAYAAGGGSGSLEAGAPALSPQAGTVKFAATKAAKVKKLAVKDAKAIVKAAGATKGTAKQKLAKIYTYIAQPSSFGGAFESVSYYDFITAAMGTANAPFYPLSGPTTMKGCYMKFAADAFLSKKVTCYHNAALFAVAAKQALGKSAKVRLAIGGTNATGTWNAHHSWVEVTLKKVVYVYDPMNGHYHATDIAKAKDGFGPFNGTKRTAATLSKYYRNGTAAPYKGAAYCSVTL